MIDGDEARDFSQFGEQAAILANTPAIGTFLDIGAYDAFTFSNVRALYENGWGGVLVEPNPSHAARLRHTYRFSLAVTVLEVAVAPVPLRAPTVRLALTDDATSTADPATLTKWAGEVLYSGSADVAAMTLPDLWSTHGPFQFVSIDAEGWSVPIFNDLLAQCRPLPACLCVEHDGRHTACQRRAEQHGYRRVTENGTNLVLAL